MKDQHVVVFDQEDKSFHITTETEYWDIERHLRFCNHKYVYTDIFTGTKEQCEKFIKDRNLKIA